MCACVPFIELAREGVPLPVIQCQLGHSYLSTTSVYLQGIEVDGDHRHDPQPARADDARQRRPRTLNPTQRQARWAECCRSAESGSPPLAAVVGVLRSSSGAETGGSRSRGQQHGASLDLSRSFRRQKCRWPETYTVGGFCSPAKRQSLARSARSLRLVPDESQLHAIGGDRVLNYSTQRGIGSGCAVRALGARMVVEWNPSSWRCAKGLWLQMRDRSGVAAILEGRAMKGGESAINAVSMVGLAVFWRRERDSREGRWPCSCRSRSR